MLFFLDIRHSLGKPHQKTCRLYLGRRPPNPLEKLSVEGSTLMTVKTRRWVWGRLPQKKKNIFFRPLPKLPLPPIMMINQGDRSQRRCGRLLPVTLPGLCSMPQRSTALAQKYSKVGQIVQGLHWRCTTFKCTLHCSFLVFLQKRINCNRVVF